MRGSSHLGLGANGPLGGGGGKAYGNSIYGTHNFDRFEGAPDPPGPGGPSGGDSTRPAGPEFSEIINRLASDAIHKSATLSARTTPVGGRQLSYNFFSQFRV